MTDWISALRDLAAAGESSVIVTVGRIRGSAPRETGARMIVTRRHTFGSIGGGQLEYGCTEFACKLLAGRDLSASVSKRTYPLGPELGQCCGGVVDMVFELLPGSQADWLSDANHHHETRTPAVVVTVAGLAGGSVVVTTEAGRTTVPVPVLQIADEILAGRCGATAVDEALLVPLSRGVIDVAVFGAGHVGRAVVELLANLDCRVRWIDSRRQVFPETSPANVTVIESAEPAREVAAIPPDAFYLIMTHSHAIDLDICYQVLLRDDARYRGLIGSKTKRRRFEKRLIALGLSMHRLDQLDCPIGIDGISGKKPAEIALSVVAQILQIRDLQQAATSGRRSLEVLG